MFVGDGSHPLDKQFRVGRFFGIPLYVHIILVLFFGLQVLMSLFSFSVSRIISGFLWPFILFGSVYLHELGHALTSAHYGNAPRRIVLHLFGGVAEVPPGLSRSQQLWVIANGPIVSLALAVVGYALYLILGSLWIVGYLAYFFFQINMVLFVFNILPIYPLDGGQFLRQWLAIRNGQSSAIRRSLPLSMGVLILAALFCLVTGSMFGMIIALFLIMVNHQEWTRWKHLFSGKQGFWGQLLPKSGALGLGRLRDHIYIWMNRSSAEILMRKADEVGVFNLSPVERKRLEKYLDAKIRLRGGV